MKDVLRQIISRGARVHVRNALAPLLWLVAVATPTMLLFAWLFGTESAFAAWLVAASFAPVLAALVAYFIFLAKDPDRLQSEEYRLEHRRLLSMERKHGTGEIIERRPDLKDYLDPDEDVR